MGTKRVLITGGAGFVGVNLIARLLDLGLAQATWRLIGSAALAGAKTRGARFGPHAVDFGDDIGRQSLDAVEFFGHLTFPERARAARAGLILDQAPMRQCV